MEINNIGFATWLELYQYIEKQGLHNEERVGLVFTPPPIEVKKTDAPEAGFLDEREVVLYLETVRANAFLELYNALPKEAAVEVLKDMLHSVTQLAGKKHTQPLLEFLNKLHKRP